MSDKKSKTPGFPKFINDVVRADGEVIDIRNATTGEITSAFASKWVEAMSQEWETQKKIQQLEHEVSIRNPSRVFPDLIKAFEKLSTESPMASHAQVYAHCALIVRTLVAA